MIQQPPYLKSGDKIAIVCPAKKLPEPIDAAIKLFESWDLEVVCGTSVSAAHHQFAGNDALRAADLQTYLDDPEIKAIVAGRGGYGTIRIIDELDFTIFSRHPKWLVGFSDITILLSHTLAKLNTQCIHAQMPMTFSEATPASLESLRGALFGEKLAYSTDPVPLNRFGSTEGILFGGNLTLLTMIEGSCSAADYDDKILFLEDVGEHEFSIDRMMRMLKRGGKLSNLRGLIVGAFNEIAEEKIYFGQTPNEIIADLVQEYNYPVCFDFPVGHIDNNLAMPIGKLAKLVVDKDEVRLEIHK